MISLDGVTKWYPTRRGRNYVLHDVTLDIPGGVNLALMGVNGAGKSTLLRLIGGIDFPNRGAISVGGSISWPVGLASGFQGSLTGRENARFVCRINGLDFEEIAEKVDFVREFAGLGDYFDMPVKTYSSGMRARLGFAVSMAFEFDYYLIDEVMAVGDADFKKKCAAEIRQRRGRSSFIMASHSIRVVKQHCDMVLLLRNGSLAIYEDVEEAIDVYQSR